MTCLYIILFTTSFPSLISFDRSLWASWTRRRKFTLLHLQEFLERLPARIRRRGLDSSSIYLKTKLGKVEEEHDIILSLLRPLLSSSSPQVKALALSIMLSLDKNPWPSCSNATASTRNAQILLREAFGSSQSIENIEVCLNVLESQMALRCEGSVSSHRSLINLAEHWDCFGRYARRLRDVYVKNGRNHGSLSFTAEFELPLIGGKPLVEGAISLYLTTAAVDELHRSLLHVALYYGVEDEICLRTFPNSRIDKADSLGFTPLHLAAIQGHFKCVKALIDQGVTPGTRDRFFSTALDYAVALGNEEIISVLRERPGQPNNTGNIVSLGQEGRLDCIDPAMEAAVLREKEDRTLLEENARIFENLATHTPSILDVLDLDSEITWNTNDTSEPPALVCPTCHGHVKTKAELKLVVFPISHLPVWAPCYDTSPLTFHKRVVNTNSDMRNLIYAMSLAVPGSRVSEL